MNGRQHRLYLFGALVLLLTGCIKERQSEDWYYEYAHLKGINYYQRQMSFDEFFILFLVDAKHWDHSNTQDFLHTMVKHPSDGCKDSQIGHAWVLLAGFIDGQWIVIEGGHSGELGRLQPRYFEGIMNYAVYGHPTLPLETTAHKVEPNPVRYLSAVQQDGFFQQGSGGHRPTYVAKVVLTKEQFLTVHEFINCYDYRLYRLSDRQCTSFLVQIGQLIDFPLNCRLTMPISQSLTIVGQEVILWQDPRYGRFTFDSPDQLEKKLIEAVRNGDAEDARIWYYRHYAHNWRKPFGEALRTLTLLPFRLQRLADFS